MQLPKGHQTYLQIFVLRYKNRFLSVFEHIIIYNLEIFHNSLIPFFWLSVNPKNRYIFKKYDDFKKRRRPIYVKEVQSSCKLMEKNQW